MQERTPFCFYKARSDYDEKSCLNLTFVILFVISLVACSGNPKAVINNSGYSNNTVDSEESNMDNTSDDTDATSVNNMKPDDIRQLYRDVTRISYELVNDNMPPHFNGQKNDVNFMCVVNIADESWQYWGDEPELITGASEQLSYVMDKLVNQFDEATAYIPADKDFGLRFPLYELGARGEVLVAFRNSQVAYVQYRDVNIDASRVEQYPDRSQVDESHIVWGTFHYAFECELCAPTS